MHQTSAQYLPTLVSLSLSLLVSQTLAQNAASGVTVPPTEVTAPAGGNWDTIVTWPAGCDKWANPCPPGAITSGVAPTTAPITWPAGCETWLNPCPAGAITSGVAPSPAVVTWPAGCETWANPCPASAVISGQAPPAVQTSAVAPAHTTMSTVVTSSAAASTTEKATGTGGFVESTATTAAPQAFSGLAVSNKVAGSALTFAGLIASFFL